AVVLTASDSNGYIYDKDGIDIDILKEIKLKKRLRIKEYIKYKKDTKYYENKKPWDNKADIALPCATENEIELVDAKNLLKNGIKYIAEGANMPCNNEAKKYILENKIIFLPAKAANAGGVSSSLMEMSQNSNF